MPPFLVKLGRLLYPGWLAFCTYWPLFLLIQSAALCVLLSYYLIDGTAGFYNRIAELKLRGGLLLSGVATVVSAGLLPELMKSLVRPKHMTPPSWGEILHQFGLWFFVGCLVDLFYRFQGVLFGHGNDAWTVVLKVLMDQLVFTPGLSLPFIVGWYLLREKRYRPIEVFRACDFKLYRRRVVPLWATALMFWPVMLLIVYSLPAPLQFPLFLCANAAWSILMIFIVRRQQDA